MMTVQNRILHLKQTKANHSNINNNHSILIINHLTLLYGMKVALIKKNIPSLDVIIIKKFCGNIGK